MSQRLPLFLAVVSAMLWSSFLLAENDIYVPESLEPWVEWVLEENPHVSCPVRATDGVRLNCIWVRATDISVLRGNTFGATFEIQVHAFAESSLQLPFSESFKPQNFMLNGQKVALGGGNSATEILVPIGSHVLKGELMWTEESEPRFLEIPRSGIVRLAIDGEPVEHPSLTAGGSRLWFSNDLTEPTETSNAPDTQVVRVFRHFIDAIPQTLTTHIKITVTGNPRILEFGRVITNEYQIMNVVSRWPAILSKEGNLVVQVTPGTNEVQIHARATDQLASFRYHEISPLWPSVEYWGMQPRHDLRIIRLEGAQRTDLSQINAPRHMSQLSGFVLTADDELKIIEEQRGSTQPYTSSFDITRDIWLNFKGDSFTVRDSIRTDIESSQRVISSIPLGEVRVDGISRLITYDDSSGEKLASVYLNTNDSHLSSVSKISKTQPLPPNTWSVEADDLDARLHLPPGWLLMWSQGIDKVEHSWLSKWGIWDIFIVLLLLCLVWGLGGWKWTAIVAGTALISYQLDQAPTIGWIVLAGMCYAVKAIKHVTLNKIANVSYWVVFVVVASACLFHATISARNALHPQLAANDTTFERQVVKTLSSIAPGGSTQYAGVTELAEFFRKIPAQFTSTSPTTDETIVTVGSRVRRESIAEEVFATGTYMAESDPTALAQTYTAKDIEKMGVEDLADNFRRTTSQFNSTLPIAIQTGPGKPNWQGRSIALEWNGLVSQDQKMSLVLLSPWMTRLLYGVSALATLLVLAYFLYLKVPRIKNCVKHVLPGTAGLTSLVLLAALYSPQDIHADIPDADLLKELEKRLLALPDCLSECAYLEEAKLTISDEVLTIAMQIHAEDRVAIPLPNENNTWNLVDLRQGANQLPLLRERSRLYTLLDKGVHDIVLTANVKGLDQLDVTFDLIPGHLEIEAPNWRIEGLIRGQVGDRKLTFSRVNFFDSDNVSATSTNSVQLNATPLEITPYVSVLRQINLTYEPTVITRVARVAPYTGEITVRIPMLPKELVTTSGLSVEDEHMVVNLKSSEQTIVWESKLEVDSTLTLTAPSIADRSERWSIRGSDFWSYSHEGIVPIDTGDNHTMFIPLSNEVLQIEIQQLQPVLGDSITVESVSASHTVDNKTTTTKLELMILASQPGDLVITLPVDASVEGFMFGGEFQSLPLSNEVLLPVQPGTQRYSLDWKTDAGVSIIYKPTSVSLSQNAVNARTSIRFPESRWTLWLAGSSLGGTVAFWSVLFGVLLAAVAISKIPGIAISTRDAIILTVGATLIHVSVLVYAGIWFIAIWFKSRVSEEITRRWLYRIGQILLCIITLVVLYVLVSTVPAALTNDPNMYITGFQSTNEHFVWFSDEIAGPVPAPWVLSLPMWTYFVLILVWVMWLVFSLLKWTRVWWQTLKTPVLWLPIEFKGMFAKLKLGRARKPV